MEPELDEQHVCRVLKPGLGRKDFEAAATEADLVHYKTIENTGERDPYEQVWSTKDGAVAVHYVEDAISTMSYIAFRGEDVTDAMFDLVGKIDHFWPEQLIEKVVNAESYDDLVNDLFRLTITFPEYEPRVFQIFERAATLAPHPKLRMAALNAMAYRGWPELLPVDERVAHDDDDPNVRREAARLLPLWDPEARAGKKL